MTTKIFQLISLVALILVIIAIVLLINPLYNYFNQVRIFGSNKKDFYVNINNDITISGVWDCLPPDFTNENNSCVRGIKDSSGNYYMLAYPITNMVPATEKPGIVSFRGIPKNTITTSDSKKVNIFFVSKIN